MTPNDLPPLVIVLSVLLQLWMMVEVGRVRGRTGIHAPATTGHPDLERALRVQLNTIEQYAMFLPSFWLASAYWSPLWAGLGGLLWLGGRVLYALAYWRDAARRGPGFVLSFGATAVLLAGGGIGWLMGLRGG